MSGDRRDLARRVIEAVSVFDADEWWTGTEDIFIGAADVDAQWVASNGPRTVLADLDLIDELRARAEKAEADFDALLATVLRMFPLQFGEDR